MAIRMIARGRHVSSAVLLWAAAVFLAAADVAAAGPVPAHQAGLRLTALVLAIIAGVMIGTTFLRGIGSLVAQVRIRRALRPRRLPPDARVRAEVHRGISQIEAFLAEQHSHGA